MPVVQLTEVRKVAGSLVFIQQFSVGKVIISMSDPQNRLVCEYGNKKMKKDLWKKECGLIILTND